MVKYIFVGLIFLVGCTGAKEGVTTSKKSKKIDFFEGSYEAMQAKAAKQDKGYFLYFWATWCGPCKTIQADVFSDKEVIQYANDNFIAYKVDVDDFDGYELKQKFNVNSIPRVIFFNEKGKQKETLKGMFAKSYFLSKMKSNS